MLVLSRRNGESVLFGSNIVVTLIVSENGQARLGFSAPPNIEIDREEVRESKQREGRRPLNLFQGFGSGRLRRPLTTE